MPSPSFVTPFTVYAPFVRSETVSFAVAQESREDAYALTINDGGVLLCIGSLRPREIPL